MFHGRLIGRTYCRVAALKYLLLQRYFSRLCAQQSRHGVNGPLKYSYISRINFRTSCSTQEDDDLSKEQSKYLEEPNRNFTPNLQELRNKNASNEFDTPYLHKGEEDMSDPCEGLDFNDINNENITLNDEYIIEESIQDERFPLPSEPLDKG